MLGKTYYCIHYDKETGDCKLGNNKCDERIHYCFEESPQYFKEMIENGREHP